MTHWLPNAEPALPSGCVREDWHDRCAETEETEAPLNQSTARARVSVSSEVVAVTPRAFSALPLARETRLELVRGMLCRLEEVTPAGQHYLMAKVLPLLRREAIDRGRRRGIDWAQDRLEGSHAARRGRIPATFRGPASSGR